MVGKSRPSSRQHSAARADSSGMLQCLPSLAASCVACQWEASAPAQAGSDDPVLSIWSLRVAPLSAGADILLSVVLPGMAQLLCAGSWGAGAVPRSQQCSVIRAQLEIVGGSIQQPPALMSAPCCLSSERFWMFKGSVWRGVVEQGASMCPVLLSPLCSQLVTPVWSWDLGLHRGMV